MITQKITCDHCGNEVPNVYNKRFTFMATNAAAQMGTIDACSKEHLGIALAKMFGIGINGESDELLDRKRRELTKLTDANNFLIIDRDNTGAHVVELESRIPANEVTNAERAQYDQTIELQRKRIADLEWRLAELTTPLTVDGKTLEGSEPASDHAHEIGSCSFCDKTPPGTASITDPSKPTKPEES